MPQSPSPNSRHSDSPDSDPSSSSSPTPTIRNSKSNIDMRPSEEAEIVTEAGPSGVGTGGGRGRGRAISGQEEQQQGLGNGRPERRPTLLSHLSSPSLSVNQPLHTTREHRAQSPGQTSLYSAFSEGPTSPTRPFTAAPGLGYSGSGSGSGSGDQTPRGGNPPPGSVRGMPHTAAVGNFSTPAHGHGHGQTASGGSSAARPGRGQRYNTSYIPSSTSFASHALAGASGTGTGTGSRSASRVRPALNASTINLAASALGQKAQSEEDDEHLEVDRGEILIRQRQKARAQARKQKERERRIVDSTATSNATTNTTDASAPPSGVPGGESFSAQQARGGSMGRSVSRTRVPSVAAQNRKMPSEGYFAGTTGLATPAGESPRDDFRAPSIYSIATDDEEEALEREREDIVEDVVNEVVEGTVNGDEDEDEEDDDDDGSDDGGVTLRDRQDAINIEHPFGLPIWKPALYRKSRSVTRNAESALHSIPSAAAERHLLPGNLLWVLLFGWWLAIACFIVAVLVSGAEVLGGGRGGYGKTLRGLAWYIGWPFGKYVEGEGAPESDSGEDEDEDEEDEDEEGSYGATADGSPKGKRQRQASDGASSMTVRGPSRNISTSHSSFDALPDEPRATTPQSAATIRPPPQERREPTISFASPTKDRRNGETEPLLRKSGFRRPRNKRAKMLGRIIYWPCFLLVVAPMMLVVCVLCWGGVITIPMAKLTWRLIELLYNRPLEINFRSAPKIQVLTPNPTASPSSNSGSGDTTAVEDASPSAFTLKRARLQAGQVAPTSGPTSTVLLCTYRAVGLQYYKYTVGGVNIMFVNLLPLVFFTIIDAFILLPAVERAEGHGHYPSPFVAFVTSQSLIFFLSLASVIPLSYFIGMAVASISAQSSIGMGAVINATFGSIIEIILYSIALMQGKGRLVEGSIVGSILAGVLLMPGASMCSGALKRKEQKFNAKSAGVTSTMLIMAIIGTLTPTMFYQTYGSFHLKCTGCPDTGMGMNETWQCDACYYEHPDPAGDPFYQEQVKTLMYLCAAILLFSYLIGLWFSLRTHASQIWQNPQQLMKPEETGLVGGAGAMHPAHRATLTQRMTPQAIMQHVLPLHKTPGKDGAGNGGIGTGPGATASTNGSPKTGTIKLGPSHLGTHHSQLSSLQECGPSSSRQPSNNYLLPAGYTPFLEGVDKDLRQVSGSSSTTHPLPPMRLPSNLTTEDFTRAVAVATVSALRHQGSIISSHPGSAQKKGLGVGGQGQHHGSGQGAPLSAHVNAGGAGGQEGHDNGEEGGGHEGPSWTRGISAGVLLGCTLLYALIADPPYFFGLPPCNISQIESLDTGLTSEILVDVIDVVLQGVRIDEKFLGLTLFALVPNTTEFMNAMSFAMNGNIALSMEIGSAYALQVCLLQIPAMVAFSAFYDPGKMGEVVDTFTLIFPQWDVIAIILSIFLLTYTYIEARSNYHRGSILVLAYIVLIMGFYFAPVRAQGEGDTIMNPLNTNTLSGIKERLTMLWA